MRPPARPCQTACWAPRQDCPACLTACGSIRRDEASARSGGQTSFTRILIGQRCSCLAAVRQLAGLFAARHAPAELHLISNVEWQASLPHLGEPRASGDSTRAGMGPTLAHAAASQASPGAGRVGGHSACRACTSGAASAPALPSACICAQHAVGPLLQRPALRYM